MRIVLNESGTIDVQATGPVVTFATPEFEVMHGSDSVGDVQFEFCDEVRLFPSEAEASEWLKSNNGPDIVPVAETCDLAKHINAVRSGGRGRFAKYGRVLVNGRPAAHWTILSVTSARRRCR